MPVVPWPHGALHSQELLTGYLLRPRHTGSSGRISALPIFPPSARGRSARGRGVDGQLYRRRCCGGRRGGPRRLRFALMPWLYNQLVLLRFGPPTSEAPPRCLISIASSSRSTKREVGCGQAPLQSVRHAGRLPVTNTPARRDVVVACGAQPRHGAATSSSTAVPLAACNA